MQNKNGLNKSVFYSSALIITSLILATVLSPTAAAEAFNQLQATIIANGSWFYVLAVAAIVTFVVYLCVSRYGSIKLGPEHASPDYKLSTWLSMLFAAGMGIGLMFFGVAEPLMHYLSPPTAEVGSLDAAKQAMKITFFHWGLNAWAIYAIVGLILAYFSYRHKLPLTLRSALHPIIGDRIYGWPGHVIDIFAVVSTVFGVATSLGLGASQVNAGLNYLFSFEVSTTNQVIIMVAITALASISVATGLDKGIKILSETNMLLAVALLALIFILGPTVFLLQAYVQNIGTYLSDIVRDTFNLFAYEKKSWIGGWTIFYWGWWLAWAPFVGLFIARISKGRTIREFIVGVMLVPTAFTLLWMTIFGNSAIALVVEQGVTNLADMVNENAAVALFVFLENFPWSQALTFLSVIMIVIFFVTSCDSGAMVIDMLCSNGNNQTPLWQRLFWACGVGVVAIILSFAGGLNALQTMTIASALPFTIVLLIAMFGLMRALKVEMAKRESLQANTLSINTYQQPEDWQDRLENIVTQPSKKDVDSYLQNKALKALNTVQQQFTELGLNAVVNSTKNGIYLTVEHGSEHDFVYGIYKKARTQPDFDIDEDIDNGDDENYYRAEVYLGEGGQDYDIMGWSRVSVINDVIDQYQKHMHFLHLLREQPTPG